MYLAIAVVTNQSVTKRHIYCCVTAKSHFIYMGTHEHNPISSSLKHILLQSQIHYKYYTPPTWQWQSFARRLLSCMLFSGAYGIQLRKSSAGSTI